MDWWKAEYHYYYDRSDLKKLIEHGINSKQQGTCDMADLLGPEYTQEFLNRGLMRKDERCCCYGLPMMYVTIYTSIHKLCTDFRQKLCRNKPTNKR